MRRVAIIACALVACTPEPGPTSRTDPILGGTADPSTTTVFLVIATFNNARQGFCTGTLISPRTILTAGHCVDPAREGASSVMVRVMNEPDDTMLVMNDLLNVVGLRRHPAYSGDGAHDLAVLQLENPVTTVAPQPLVRTPPTSWVGQPIRVVGYGRTSASVSDTGTRRSVNASIASADADTFDFGQAGALGICSGDSGGPSLWRGPDQRDRVAGVHSYGTSSQCGVGADVRVDAELTFIDAALAAYDPPSCSADGRCQLACTPADPDCRCVADGRCEACAGGPVDPDCPANCTANGVCQNAGCATPDQDCLGDGDVCLLASECDGTRCLTDTRGFSFCSRPCTDDTSCTREMVCVEGVCRPPATMVPMPSAVEGVRGGCASVPLEPALLLFLASRWLRRCSTRG